MFPPSVYASLKSLAVTSELILQCSYIIRKIGTCCASLAICVLLTATPHSGQTEEFQSVIGLLKPEFKKEIPNHLIRIWMEKYPLLSHLP